MADVSSEPVNKALSRIKKLRADEEARRLAFVRDKPLIRIYIFDIAVLPMMQN